MKLTQITRQVLKVRRDRRDMERDGWEFIGEGGGCLWELERGYRTRHVITDVRIAASGKGLWIKTAQTP
ncbi:MAG: hypothetical protein EKK31_11725 [Hyphomicrobiales bacterium]|nr:MAG: hypothetical protein EKK31_11725 [Hyphomicrobiales bacterium]